MFWAVVFSLLGIYIWARVWQKSFFRSISFIAAPFVRLYIFKRIANKLEDPERFKERFGIPSAKRPAGDLIWIHAVSVGEVMSCLPFIDTVQKNYPEVKILLTTTTLTSKEIVQERLGDRVIHQFMPFDVFTWIRRFVKFWKPKAAFFVESELWPNMLFYLYEKDIPIYLLNTRISQKSLDRMLKFKSFFSLLPYRLFREVFVPSEEIRDYVRDLGGSSITIVPNLKVISNKLPCSLEDSLKIKNMLAGRKVWLAVSTHPGEEEILIEIHKDLKQKFPDLLTVLALRHPNRAAEVAELCSGNNLSFSMFSETFSKGAPLINNLYIIDKIGVLGMFFENIDTVFVGGSLIPGIGGHNILEPLSFRCNVVTGIHTENFRDFYTYTKDSWKKIETKAELAEFIKNSLENYSKKDSKLDIEQYRTKWERLISRIFKDIFRR